MALKSNRVQIDFFFVNAILLNRHKYTYKLGIIVLLM